MHYISYGTTLSTVHADFQHAYEEVRTVLFLMPIRLNVNADDAYPENASGNV